MNIQLYNTLTRKKEIFKPIRKKHVGIYTCGPTVYWYQHIGNLRSYIFPDVLIKTLDYNNFKVKQIMNYTDVGHLTSDADEGEDKIEEAAKKENKTASEIATHYAKVFEQDLKKLNISKPSKVVKATDHIKDQIALIKTLEKKGFTYQTSDGLYFDTSRVEDYGSLALLKKENIQAGHRVSMREKKHPTDFALWKFSPSPGVRQQEWKFKDKMGFPGWHIECSAMSMKYLGEHFDIHTGGEDHIPIHHPNEIAQSESATGKKFVNYWLHGAFLTFKGEKVSKSKGGLYTISELSQQGFSPLSYRYLCLLTHYRKPLEFSLDSLEAAQNALNNLKEKLLELKKTNTKSDKNLVKQYKSQFLTAINNDLDMPVALSLIWKLLKEKDIGDNDKRSLILNFDSVLGLDLKDVKPLKLSDDIKNLIRERERARGLQDYKKSDQLRAKLDKLGVVVEDTPSGVKWKTK